ncbi:MAG: hypothetical protein HYS07_01425 [Chlamydiae bacterium]|nr:hypothetical protein [Chlamydiota bacterium]MBI3277794.1 hypothetical protein [Chlamydiota bacterium]
MNYNIIRSSETGSKLEAQGSRQILLRFLLFPRASSLEPRAAFKAPSNSYLG